MRMGRGTFRWLLKSYGVALGVWMSVGLLSVVQQKVNHPGPPLKWSLIVSLVAFFFTAAVLTPPVFYLGRKYALARQATLRRILLYVSGAPLFVFAYACVRLVIAPPQNPDQPQVEART